MIKDLFAGIKSIVSPGQPMVKAIESYGMSGGQSVFSLESGGFKPGGRELIAAYNTSPNLRKAVGLIANSMASTPFYLVKKRSRKGKKAWPLHTRSLMTRAARKQASQETEEIWEHPFLDFLYRGSPLMSGPQALKASYAYKEVKGEFFWQLMAGERTPPAAWVVIPPQSVASTPSADKQRFKLQVSGHTVELPAEEVFWSRDLNLSDLWGRGAGVGDSLADELDTDEYAAQLLRHTLANKGFKDTLISIKAEAGATPRLAEQLEAKYNQRSRSFYNTGRAMVVDGAQVDVKSLTHDLGELKLLDLRNFERDIIHQTFGIPPELFGLISNSNRATIEAAEAIFAQMVLVPRLEAMRLELQWKILPLFDPRGEYLVEFVSPVPGDKAYRLEVMKAAPGAFLVNDWRETAGLPAIDGGDVPLVQPAPMAPPPATKTLTKAAAETAATLSRADIEAILAKIDSQDLVDKMSPEWQARVEGAAEVAYGSFPDATGDFALINPHVRTHMEAFGAQLITGIDGTTKARVAAALAAGMEAGEGTAQLAKRVREQMDQIAYSRATLIARTEAVKSANFANQIGWEATGLELQKEWVSALVSTTRESHAALHGTVVELKGDFTFDGSLNPNIAEAVQQPGLAQSAAHACNCLCTTVAFDPMHESDMSRRIHGSEAHVQLAKGFEDHVDDWERWAYDVMSPYYERMGREVMAELERRLG